MRILVVGDSYCPVAALRPAFAGIARDHAVDFMDVVDDDGWTPRTPSEMGLREYLGSPAQLIDRLDGHDVLVVQGAPVSDAVLDAAPLRLVCVVRGGPVNVDLPAATARGIPVVTSPGKNADSVAELTLALLVMLARHVPAAMRFVDGGAAFGSDNWEGTRWFGHELAAQTLGLVGFGQVGRRVAARALAFGMEVIAHDPFVPPSAIEALGARSAALEELLAGSDHVSLHARLTPAAVGLMDASRFEAMRRGATLVNTARAELVAEPALIDALASGHLGGAALDVSTPGSATHRHPLLAFPNVVILPHIGGATQEALARGGALAAAEIERFAAGQPLQNVTNPEVLAHAAARR